MALSFCRGGAVAKGTAVRVECGCREEINHLIQNHNQSDCLETRLYVEYVVFIAAGDAEWVVGRRTLLEEGLWIAGVGFCDTGTRYRIRQARNPLLYITLLY